MPDDEVLNRARERLGQVLRGKYRLDAVLGIGGMAAVYAATHRNQKRFAIKMLRTELSAHTDLRQRFLREGYVANSVEHPGAVTVLDDDVAEDGAAFLVIELLEGESVDRLLESHPEGLPPRSVLAIADGLLATLAAAHAKSIVHRDIKPANLFVTREGQLKVLDFGIARLRDAGSAGATSTGILLGTPAFMAPEQALGNTSDIDARTDVFAVGATMFTLLSGKLVHEGDNGAQLMVRAATVRARSVTAVCDVPRPIAEVIDRALSFPSVGRWPDATSMRDALRAAATACFGAQPGPETLFGLLPPRPHQVSIPDHSSAAMMKTALAPSTARRSVEPGSTTAQPTAGAAATAPSAPPSRARTLALVAGACALAAGGWLFGRPRSPAPAVTTKAAPSTACATPCAQSSAPSTCVDGACVPLESEDCKVLAEPEDRSDDHTLWIGTMFPATGQAGDSFGRAHTNAANLARHDFAQVAHGIVTRTGAARHVALVACDDAADPERAARHLVNDLHVPAIIGFYKSQEAIDLARSLFVPRGVVVVAANNRNPLVTAVPVPSGSPRLVWRANASATQVAGPIARIVEDVFGAELRKERVVKADEPVRVAVVRGGTPTSLALGDAIAVERSKVAGASFDDTFRQFVLDDDTPDVAGAVRAVLAFRPQVVVDEFDTMGAIDVLAGVEKARKSARGAAPRYAVVDMTNESLARLVAADPELRRRVLGVDTVANTANLRFALRYNELYAPKATSSETLSIAYDAFYLLAYAAVAADEPIDGASIARAIPLLAGPGKPIEVGATGIFDAMNALRAGKPIALLGTAGPLAFDAETGDRRLDFAVTCYRVAPERTYSVESGLIYRVASGRLEGSQRCP